MLFDRSCEEKSSFYHFNAGGGGVFNNEGASSSSRGDTLASIVHSQTGTSMSVSNSKGQSNGLQQPPEQQPSQSDSRPSTQPYENIEANRKDWVSDPHSTDTPMGCNEIFFGEADRISGLSYKEREERVRQLRLRQQEERQRKLEELKEQAASAQRFREQQEMARRQRFEEMRNRDLERRQQVEERKKMIAQAEQERRFAVVRKNEEREQRLELKRRQETSNAVFAFGSSTPRMLDPKDRIHNDSLSGRRSTSTSNVNAPDTTSTSVARKTNDLPESDLSRKRAVSAHSLNRRTDGDDSSHPFEVRSATAARRRTDLMPTVPTSRDSPRQRSPGSRSGVVTPSTSSRPTSSLSQSSAGAASQVAMRTKSSPKRPRPTSIAGSVLSSADKPRESRPSPVSASTPTPSSCLNRSSRSWEKRLSSGSIDGATPSRNRSLGVSDSAGAASVSKMKTPSSRRTPAQVKAESAAKKASERNKAASKPRSTPRTGPQSSTVETKGVVESGQASADQLQTIKTEEQMIVSTPDQPSVNSTSNEEKIDTDLPTVDLCSNDEIPPNLTNAKETSETIQENDAVVDRIDEEKLHLDVPVTPSAPSNKSVEIIPDNEVGPNEESKTATLSTPADKAITGYASEQDYKAVLAEKRRQAREAKEKELELQRQQQIEEEERERREEEEYLRLMEEQKKAEEERLRQAIEEAEKQRKMDAEKREEEEKLRIEAEEVERQKKLEAEERMKKEEEERQLRKSRVAAIMSRTRGKGAPSTNSKSDASTPMDEAKTLSNSLMSESMAENLINRLSSTSMTDSMIAEAIETENRVVGGSFDRQDIESPLALDQSKGNDLISAPLVNGNSQQPNGSLPIDENSDPAKLFTDLDLLSSVGSNTNLNGVPQNGAHSPNVAVSQGFSSDVFDPFAPVTPAVNVATSSPSVAFDQIIDLNKSPSKLISGDVLKNNSPPPSPIIAFEENLNRKACDATSTVPDFLL